MGDPVHIHLMLKQKLSNETDTESPEYENFCKQIEAKIGRGLAKRKKTPLDKLDALENGGLMAPGKYDTLRDIFEHSGNSGFLSFIDEADAEIEACRAPVRGATAVPARTSRAPSQIITERPLTPKRPLIPPEGLTDKPWREVECQFSPQYEQQLRENMKHQFDSYRVKRANLLLLGPIKHGKSAFMNSVASVCKDRIATVAFSGDDIGSSLTTKYAKYAPITGMMTNFCLFDTMGIEPVEGHGLHLDDISNLVNGNVCRDYRFNPRSPITELDMGFIKHPRDKDKIHCCVVVIDAEQLSTDGISKRTRDLVHRLKTFEIHKVVVLTKIDRICRKVDEDIANIFKSVKVHQMVERASELFRIPENLIFPLKNYHVETEVDFKLNIPILLALKTMLSVAADYIETQKGDEDDDED